MSIDDLKNDLGELKKDLALNIRDTDGITDVGDVTRHLKNTLWPFLEAVVARIDETVAELDDLDGAVVELASEEGDMLSQETAGVFANAFMMAEKLADALKARLRPDEAELSSELDQFKVLLARCMETLNDVVAGDDSEDDDDEGDEDDKEDGNA